MVQSIKGQKSIANCISRLQQKPLLQQIAFQDFKIAKFKVLMFKLYSATEGPSFHTTTAPPAWSLQVVQQVVAAASVAVAPPPPCPAHHAGARWPPAGIKPIRQTEHLFTCRRTRQKSSCIVALTWNNWAAHGSPAARARAAWASSCSAASSWSSAAWKAAASVARARATPPASQIAHRFPPHSCWLGWTLQVSIQDMHDLPCRSSTSSSSFGEECTVSCTSNQWTYDLHANRTVYSEMNSRRWPLI